MTNYLYLVQKVVPQLFKYHNVVYKEWNLNVSRWKRLIESNDPTDVWCAGKER